MSEFKVDVLLQHYEGDENWTASVPLVEGCLAEGPTAEAASEAIVPELQHFLEINPSLKQTLMEGDVKLAKVTLQDRSNV